MQDGRGHIVVVDLAEELTMLVGDVELHAVGLELRDLLEGARSGPHGDELHGRTRRRAALAHEAVLLPYEGRTVPALGQLHRPSVVGPEPKADARASETQIRGVVVGRVLMDVFARPVTNPGEELIRLRQHDVAVRDELRLTFPHGGLPTPECAGRTDA